MKGEVVCRGQTRGLVVRGGQTRGEVVRRGQTRGEVVCGGQTRGEVVACDRCVIDCRVKCFQWKEMSSSSSETNRLPDDHPIIRVERSTWEVQAALKMVIANVEDLHVHKV